MRTISTPSILSTEQIRQFQEQGFCLAENLYSKEEIEAIEAFFEEYKHNGQRVYDREMTFEEIDPKERQLRAMHPHRYNQQALGWALQAKVVAALSDLLGSPPLLAQTMYYFKPPGARGQGMHQDNFYLLAAPHTCIAAWTAIDDAVVDNGCLYVVPGSHRKDIFCPNSDQEAWKEYGDSHIRPFPRDMKPVSVEVPRGATLFFGGNLIHGSGPNRTKATSRRTFIGHYIDEASDKIARFYQPIIDAKGNAVPRVESVTGGGPCGDGWLGTPH